jgi:hypothetical protein
MDRQRQEAALRKRLAAIPCVPATAERLVHDEQSVTIGLDLECE